MALQDIFVAGTVATSARIRVQFPPEAAVLPRTRAADELRLLVILSLMKI